MRSFDGLRSRWTGAFLVAMVLAASPAALAQEPDPFSRGIDILPFKPTPTENGVISLEGAALPVAGHVQAGLLLDFGVGLLPLYLGNQRVGELMPLRIDGHLFASYSPHARVEVALALPVTLFQSNDFGLLGAQGFPLPAPAAAGLGDVRVFGRFGILPHRRYPIDLAAILELRLPTGDGTAFIGEQGVVIAPRLAIEFPIGPVRLVGNAGVRFRTYAGRFLNLLVSHDYNFGLGVVYRLPKFWGIRELDFVAETQMATQTTAPFTFTYATALKTPWEVLVGLRARVAKHWRVELDIGRGVTLGSAYGREAFRVITGVRFDWEPLAVRRQQTVAKKLLDTDKDGIPDIDDACPTEPEDFDGFSDEDGCPDPDNDFDGVLDVKDACPMDPGPLDNNGCPVGDRDRDTLLDLDDVCPDEPGPVENGGCPDNRPNVELEAGGLRLKGTVLFETGKAIIRPQSFPLLNEVYEILSKNPKVGPIRIDGHTDNQGSRPYNIDLSRRRAQAVREHLVQKGISASRLRTQGFGFDVPVATNETPEGRQKNRRVDFTVIEVPPEPKPVPPDKAAKPAPKDPDEPAE
ncbi:MAG: OmpA family protein [Myxococcaceae bacterium]